MINKALYLARIYWGLSQAELSKKLEISQSYLSEIESGVKEPSLGLIRAYSEALNIRLSQLLFFAEGLNENEIPKGKKAILASRALSILETLAPKESTHGEA